MPLRNHDAVSPVIGTVLMVAVTVIVAAFVGAYAFGLVFSVERPRQVGMLTVAQSSDDIVISYHGGPDHEALEWFRIVAPDGAVYYSTEEGITADEGARARPRMGTTFVLLGNATGERDHVIIVGHFIEGDEQVMYEAWL